ncbi:uncharacterized protein BDR25DRAFT_310858 [Lindgomyces ingoldianus]|uniref:Uncharacterized protein n=1 Tax=Lindgomyces ingoldianus TaxID=673940 RepID=A0ACB6R898_9PLEO|nr:uncharacterized protein BDR25DRAFT_310858 [Lindgomyces ingoldianus]KAF2475498.1 hypothetical protein BDR25DRAFT_310858 [Lindgomyces ingoldianus]
MAPVSIKVDNKTNSCGFPDGPDCVSLGEGANGLEQFADDGCCLLPLRCGNGDGGEKCERYRGFDKEEQAIEGRLKMLGRLWASTIKVITAPHDHAHGLVRTLELSAIKVELSRMSIQ